MKSYLAGWNFLTKSLFDRSFLLKYIVKERSLPSLIELTFLFYWIKCFGIKWENPAVPRLGH